MNSESTSINSQRLADLASAINADIARGQYFGAVALVARKGQIVFHQAFGVADPETQKPIRLDSVFSILSLTKAFTNLLVFQSIERGRLSLTTPVAEVIPEFAGHGRERISVLHLLTHTSGLPSLIAPATGPDVGRLDYVIAAICRDVVPTAAPGLQVSYSPSVAHALLGEIARRLDPRGRSFSALMKEDVFEPLHMHDTSLGLRADLKPRHVPLRFRHPPRLDVLAPQMWAEDAEMPWVGAASTASDLFTFTEMLRSGGRSDGRQIVSPAVLALATKNHTDERPNEFYNMFTRPRGWGDLPAYIGLGFFLRGEAICPHRFGNLATPGTYGHTGAGSSLFWIDPERDLTFVCLTAGLIEEADNFIRFHRYSDMVSSAAE